MGLLSVTAVMADSDQHYYHFAAGTGPGGPWRNDSVYLSLDDFVLIEGPIERSVSLFVPHGTSELSGAEVTALQLSLLQFITAVTQADSADEVFGSGAEYQPGLSGFSSWSAAKVDIVAIANALLAWIDKSNVVAAGMNIIRQ